MNWMHKKSKQIMLAFGFGVASLMHTGGMKHTTLHDKYYFTHKLQTETFLSSKGDDAVSSSVSITDYLLFLPLTSSLFVPR